MAAQSGFTPIALSPVLGALDTRSRPADLAAGSLRYLLNFATNKSGQRSRRAGHAALNFGQRSDSETAVNNWDFHRRGGTREPVTLGFESTSPEGLRRLFVGTQSALAYMDNSTSEWTTIASGLGAAGSRFHAAALQDKVFFTNNINAPLMHTLGSGTVGAVGDLPSTKARVVAQFYGAVFWMNVVELGQALPTRVRWSDYQLGSAYGSGTAGFFDLDYGDTILGAMELLDALYIFTDSSIWRCIPSGSTDVTSLAFAFRRIYREPKNQTGCLAYPNTLCTDGRALYWWARDSIWSYNPYIAAPEQPKWLLDATGHVFSDDNLDRVERRCCESPIGEYDPDSRELRFSYPLASVAPEPLCVNNRSLFLNVAYKTADIVDRGYSMFVNFRRTPNSTQQCNNAQVFIGADGADYCLKSLGGVFQRDTVALVGAAPQNDIPDDVYVVTSEGYYSRMVGRVPIGLPTIEKTLNHIILDHDTDLSENLVTLRVGNSEHVADPMAVSGNCTVQWHVAESNPLSCPDPQSMDSLAADGMRPSDEDTTHWDLYEQGKFLYFDFRVTNANGGAPSGSDSAWSSLIFDVATN